MNAACKYRIMFFYSALFLAPVFLWSAYKVSTGKIAVYSLGELFGILSFVLLFSAVILSARNRVYDKLFCGLGNVYSIHSKIAQLGFVFALYHPIFLIGKYATKPDEIIDFLWFPTKYEGALQGFFAITFLFAVITTTLYANIRYDIWNKIHRYAVAGFIVLAFWHILDTESSLLNYAALYWYIVFIGSIAAVAFVLNSVIKPLLRPKNAVKLLRSRKLNKFIREVVIEKPDGFDYKPGQYAFVTFFDKNNLIKPEPHPFSFTSHPAEDNVSFCIKDLGDFTHKLVNHKFDLNYTKAHLEGAYGLFNYKLAKNKNQIWIAGGIGVTPFIPMLKDLDKNSQYNINFIYSVNNKSESVYTDKIEEISRSSKNIKFVLYESDKRGLLSLEKIKNIFNITGNDKKFSVLVCAPPAMIESIKQQAKNDDSIEEVISEEFSL